MIVWRFAQVKSALNSFRSRLAALLPSDPCRRTRKEYSSRNSFCLFVTFSSPSLARLLASFRALRYFVKSGGVRSSMLHKIRIWYQFFKIIWEIRKGEALARLLRQVPVRYFSVLLLTLASRLYLHVVEGCYLAQFEDYFPEYLAPEY